MDWPTSTEQAEALRTLANDTASAAVVPSNAYGAGTPSFVDQIGALATGYLSRRIDVDIARRLDSRGTVGLSSDQRSVRSTPTTGISSAGVAGMSWGTVALVAGALVGGVLLYRALS